MAKKPKIPKPIGYGKFKELLGDLMEVTPKEVKREEAKARKRREQIKKKK